MAPAASAAPHQPSVEQQRERLVQVPASLLRSFLPSTLLSPGELTTPQLVNTFQIPSTMPSPPLPSFPGGIPMLPQPVSWECPLFPFLPRNYHESDWVHKHDTSHLSISYHLTCLSSLHQSLFLTRLRDYLVWYLQVYCLFFSL